MRGAITNADAATPHPAPLPLLRKGRGRSAVPCAWIQPDFTGNWHHSSGPIPFHAGSVCSVSSVVTVLTAGIARRVGDRRSAGRRGNGGGAGQGARLCEPQQVGREEKLAEFRGVSGKAAAAGHRPALRVPGGWADFSGDARVQQPATRIQHRTPPSANFPPLSANFSLPPPPLTASLCAHGPVFPVRAQCFWCAVAGRCKISKCTIKSTE